MVEVKELSSEKVQQLYSENNLSYVKETAMAISAFDGEVSLGTCLYDMTSTAITIRLILPNDNLTMADSMLRSALFIAANRGIMEAYFLEPVSVELIKRLGFLGNESTKTIDITNLFNPCGCK